MTSARTIVFDLDGTLVDTAPDLINALNFVLDREGLPPVPLYSARNMIGAGARRLIERAGGERSAATLVGDAGRDIGVARRAGIPVIGVEFGYTDVPIADLKPDRLINHMRELPAAVESLIFQRNPT